MYQPLFLSNYQKKEDKNHSTRESNGPKRTSPSKTFSTSKQPKQGNAEIIAEEIRAYARVIQYKTQSEFYLSLRANNL